MKKYLTTFLAVLALAAFSSAGAMSPAIGDDGSWEINPFVINEGCDCWETNPVIIND